MTKDLTSYKISRGLVETTDPELENKPICRRPGFDGITSLGEMEERISAFLKRAREREGLTRGELAPMLGLSESVYGRYERAFSKMTVTRMIHLCELLGFTPMDMIFDAAPHLWGRTEEEARDRLTIAHLLRNIPTDTLRDLIRILTKLAPEDVEKSASKSDHGSDRG
ncbi:transcriptional regulator with XRE-family HTH domain [Rhizobium petrolearium]|uniref:Helix-turn-helix transcriptional regulator n=2 Tax=Neorhizobium TaxID=1525371 RepID=A0ABV0MDS7_9HYPH|nr:helix-turn-helix transcriptional regulator [Neorhizobium petrolearium]MBP1848326.1 transcriptional regulator with XRE-family HTH domain [Neorhizobium petrolearium]MCC2614546.1 helix-turn-helix transcriptional regulator [Neorhizobium petrolearium]WGI72305.1 helix-turn-helix transcriptional regulator [Neorhizobium petrolearium]